MNHKFKHTLLILTLLLSNSIDTFSCTCIGLETQTIEKAFDFSELIVKARVISVDYYNDTLGQSLNGTKFDSAKSGYLIQRLKLFKLVVTEKFKSVPKLSDTISILTGLGNGDCGFMFKIGKEYIIYAEPWFDKQIVAKSKKWKSKSSIVKTKSRTTFYTDICDFTKESNVEELEKLKSLSH